MSVIYIQNQTIKLFNSLNKDELLGTIEIRTEPSDGKKLYSSGEWCWIGGRWLNETGTWKFNNVLVANKLHRVMDLDNREFFYK